MKKRTFVGVVTLFLCLVCFTGVAAFADTVNTWVLVEKKDSTVEAKIVTDGKSSVGELTLKYDKTGLSVEDADIKFSESVDVYAVNTKKDGTVVIAYVSEKVVEKGELVTVTFKVDGEYDETKFELSGKTYTPSKAVLTVAKEPGDYEVKTPEVPVEDKEKNDDPKEDTQKEDTQKDDTQKEDIPKEDTQKDDTSAGDTQKGDTQKGDTQKNESSKADGEKPAPGERLEHEDIVEPKGDSNTDSEESQEEESQNEDASVEDITTEEETAVESDVQSVTRDSEQETQKDGIVASTVDAPSSKGLPTAAVVAIAVAALILVLGGAGFGFNVYKKSRK